MYESPGSGGRTENLRQFNHELSMLNAIALYATGDLLSNAVEQARLSDKSARLGDFWAPCGGTALFLAGISLILRSVRDHVLVARTGAACAALLLTVSALWFLRSYWSVCRFSRCSPWPSSR